jgi:hypothetical protein
MIASPPTIPNRLAAAGLRALLDYPSIALYFSARLSDPTASGNASSRFEVTVAQLAEGAGVSSVAARESLHALSALWPPPKVAVPGLWFEAVPSDLDAPAERFRIAHVKEVA